VASAATQSSGRSNLDARNRRANQVDLAWLATQVRPETMAAERVLPVLAGLDALLPALRRGSTLGVGSSQQGATSLLLAALAGPLQAGAWAAVVGLPALGPLAAAELGAELSRLVLVPHAGSRWSTVVGALLDGLDVVAVRPPVPARVSDARILAARARERGSVLVVVGSWPEPLDIRLSVEAGLWEGLESERRLCRRRVEVRAVVRRGPRRELVRTLWLPGPVGQIGLALEDSSMSATMREPPTVTTELQRGSEDPGASSLPAEQTSHGPGSPCPVLAEVGSP
jgi:hypothetical protein